MAGGEGNKSKRRGRMAPLPAVLPPTLLTAPLVTKAMAMVRVSPPLLLVLPQARVAELARRLAAGSDHDHPREAVAVLEAALKW